MSRWVKKEKKCDCCDLNFHNFHTLNHRFYERCLKYFFDFSQFITHDEDRFSFKNETISSSKLL